MCARKKQERVQGETSRKCINSKVQYLGVIAMTNVSNRYIYGIQKIAKPVATSELSSGSRG